MRLFIFTSFLLGVTLSFNNVAGYRLKKTQLTDLNLFKESFSELAIEQSADCGQCVFELQSINASNIPDILSKIKECNYLCTNILTALEDVCCPSTHSLSYQCTLFGITCPDDTLTPPEENPSAVYSCDCGCSKEKCIGEFNPRTCCDLVKFTNLNCVICIVCLENPNKCDKFTEGSKPPTTGLPNPTETTAAPVETTAAPVETTSSPSQSGEHLMSDFFTSDSFCEMFGNQRWWYPTGGPDFSPSQCRSSNYTDCKPAESFWGSYGPEGRYLDFWDQSGFSGTTFWDKNYDREECKKAVNLLLKDVDDALKLVRSKDNSYGKLFNNGNDGLDRLEVAAFWAHVGVETGGLSDFYERVNDPEQMEIYGKYYGRGPLQLSYEPNYKAFSDFMGKPEIMSNPDIIINDPVLMWASGFFFWMNENTFDVWSNKGAIGVCSVPHKGSMHWAITEGPGFGLSIAMLNGAVECNPKNVQSGQKRWEKMNSRVKNLLWNMHILKVTPPSTPGLIIPKNKPKDFWSSDFVALPDYFTEGCPPIHEGKEKLKCRGQLQKFGYDENNYGHKDPKKGPFYAGWNGGGQSFDTQMGWKTYFDAPYPSVQSADAVGYVQRFVDCNGKSSQMYLGGQYECTKNICAANPKKHLWITRSILRYQCDNTPTGESVPSACPIGDNEKWPVGKWKTNTNQWPNVVQTSEWKAPQSNYEEDSNYSIGGGDTETTSEITGPRPETDFADKKKIQDLLTEDLICDMFSWSRWFYPNGEVDLQVCETCGPRSEFPANNPPMQVEDLNLAKKLCTASPIPVPSPWTSVDLFHACRASADNSKRSTGNVESVWGSYAGDGAYVWNYGQMLAKKAPYENYQFLNSGINKFLEVGWNRDNDRKQCRKAAGYVIEDMEAALKVLRTKNSRFDKLFNNGNEAMDKIEMAAFLAHVNKETGSLSDWIESVDSEETKTYGNGNIMCDPNSEYKCVKDAWYNGRGPLQLSWNYNYGKFSEFYYNDSKVLLENPRLLVQDPVVGWASAFWYWMENNEFDVWSHTMGSNVCPFPHKGSMHDAITRSKGFGLSIAIINGQVECSPYNGDYQRKTMPLARLRYFVYNLWLMKIPLPQGLTVDKEKFWEHEFMSIPSYFYEGCPMIHIDSKKGSNRSCLPKCKAMVQKLGFDQNDPQCSLSGGDILGCPDCSTAAANNSLVGAVRCGYNLNDPTSYGFELPFPHVGSLQSLDYTAEGKPMLQYASGEYKGDKFYYPLAFSNDFAIAQDMCVFDITGKKQLGKVGNIELDWSTNTVKNVEVLDCPPQGSYCCWGNTHKVIEDNLKIKIQDYSLWNNQPMIRFQCDHCPEECAGGKCEAPESVECPTGSCEMFSPKWGDGDWNTNRAQWPGNVL